MAYDGLGRRVQIVETTSGSVTSTKNFIWCGNDICEERDSGGSVTRQFFDDGERISGTTYYFTTDHLGTIREMTNSAGTIVWQQSFDPYGNPTTIVNTTPADFGYAGYYLHNRSGLNLTRTRAYSASFGRFINRDPIEEEGGINLYGYVGNNPITFTDPFGTDGKDPDAPGGIKNFKDCAKWCDDNSKCISDPIARAAWRLACIQRCSRRFPPPPPVKDPHPARPKSPGGWIGPSGNARTPFGDPGIVPIPIPGTPGWNWTGINTPLGPVPIIPVPVGPIWVPI
jgi:RHS repeat-associated protein